jgi:peptide/nickel transport system permease protein
VAPYIARRLFEGVIVLWLLVTAVFIAVRLLPGGPAVLLTNPEFLTPEVLDRINAQLGLDKSVPEQYFAYLKALLLHGDLGHSYGRKTPVTTLLQERLVWTLVLAFATFIFSLVAGVAIGMLAAWKERGWLGGILRPATVFMVAMPGFWFGLMLIYVFAIKLEWLPTGGVAPAGEAATPDVLAWHLVLPTLALSINWVGNFALYTNSSLSQTLSADYIRTARAKGLGWRRVLTRHALPNASIPVITQAGISVPHLIAGSVVVEQIFSWPGIGRLTIESMYRQDYPVLLGVVLLTGFVVVIANLVVDVLYRVVNPAVRI